VGDGKVALALTAITCVVAVCVALAAPLIIWVIRETSKASVAGVAQQVSETNQLVKSSIEQNSAVMSALIALTGQHMQATSTQVQLPPAPQPVMKQIQPAQPSISIDGKGIGWDKATVNKAAAKIYYTLYKERIEPTQANIKDRIKELQSTSLISAAMQELKSLGWAESNGAGSGYKWVYDDAPANTDTSPTVDAGADQSAKT
jgi:energy-converting hydrogenase Eha subunit F